MLFNSLVFLLLFLPLAACGSLLAERAGPRWRVGWLVGVSALFYASFDARFLPLLAASIGLNWAVARLFVAWPRALLIGGAVAANLLLLGVFKYADFLAGIHGPLPGLGMKAPEWAFPLGISFFTFQHIAYLADLKAGRSGPAPLWRYAVYIGFFPKVIAGPLVRPAEFLPQLDAPPREDRTERLARGLLLLVLGLGKKVFVGDPLGGLVDPVHAGLAAGESPGLAEAWLATLAYTFQLYFDFSAYTDMALGLALVFGIRLPENFQSPYRATSIQDFWRRWHITLSLFLRDYLYIPFGGNRHGLPLQLVALLATMTLGGLWHGAGWTFVAWGAAHGVALGAHLVWRRAGLALPAAAGWLLTFGFVALAWVPFRSRTFEDALAIYRALFGGAPLGPAGEPWHWGLLLLAAALAVVGPTAFALAQRAPPRLWVGVAAALLLAAILVQVGDDANRDFIYARF